MSTRRPSARPDPRPLLRSSNPLPQAPAGVEATVAVTLQPTDAPPPANIPEQPQADNLTTTQAGNIAEIPQADNLAEPQGSNVTGTSQDGGQKAKRNSLSTAKPSTSDTGKPRRKPSNTPARKSSNADRSPDKQKPPHPP